MKSRNKFNVLYYITSIFLIIIIFLCALYPFINPYIKKKLAIEKFNNNYDKMCSAVQILQNSNIPYVYVGSNNMINDEMLKMKDIALLKALITKNPRYKYIEKRENVIYFTAYASLGNGYGVAYSLDESPPIDKMIIDCERLNNDGWYYYQID